jgi:hypothetical protein
MKKILFCVFFFSLFGAFAQDFSFQWVNDMSMYIGRRTRDIPDIYVREGNGNSYSRMITNEIWEGFETKDNIIISSLWGIISNRRSYIFVEFDRIMQIINAQIGEPLSVEENLSFWNWNGKMIMLAVDGNLLSLMICSPERFGMTQDIWDELSNNYRE